jgi:long-chain acyl-CoA synthetase
LLIFSSIEVNLNIYCLNQVDGISDRSITYGQLRDLCRVLSIRLQTVFKLSHADTIAVCLPNSIEFPVIVLGACEAGVEVTTVNPIYTAGECQSYTQ